MLAHQVEEAFFVDELNDREKHERTAARLRLIWITPAAAVLYGCLRACVIDTNCFPNS